MWERRKVFMNLPTKITVLRLFLTIVIVALLCIPFSFFGFNFPKYDVNGVAVELNYIIAGVTLIKSFSAVGVSW